MKPSSQLRTVLTMLALVIFAIFAWPSVPQIYSWTRQRMGQRLQREITSLPEEAAAQRIGLVEGDDRESLQLLVAALAETRKAAVAAAQMRLLDMLETWERSTPAGKSQQIADLASLLAASAPQLAPEKLAFVQTLAQKLLAWPIDGRLIDAAKLIADCQAILELPTPELADVRLAAIPRPPAKPEPGPEPNVERAAAPPAPVVASGDSPQEPRRLAKPKAMRLSDQ